MKHCRVIQIFAAALVLLFFFSRQSAAQETDTLIVVPDSLLLAADSLGVLPDSLAGLVDTLSREPVRFTSTVTPYRQSSLYAETDIYPRAEPGVEIVEQLQSVEASFTYDLTTPGWPSLWTRRGLPDNAVNVSWDGFRFDELFTGRPAYELLPRGLLDTLSLGPALRAVPLVSARTAPFLTRAPITELAYRASNKGLQYVYGSHQQQRSRTIAGAHSLIGVRFGYMGEKADGEYPGSRLERARGIYGSLSIQRRGFGIEISDLANRRRIGAHGGVIPVVPGDPNSIYQRFGAIVDDGSAERRTIRNDLSLRTTWDSAEGVLSTVQIVGRWTQQTFRFRNPSDTLFVKSRRFSGRGDIYLDLGGYDLGMHGVVSDEAVIDEGIIPVSDRQGLSRSSAWLSLSKNTAPFLLTASSGVSRSFDRTSHSASLAVESRISSVHVSLDGARSIPDLALITQHGFGSSATVTGPPASGYVNEATLGVKLLAGTSTLGINIFTVVAENPRDWFATTSADSIVYRALPGNLTTTGATITAGFRDRATRGFYLDAEGTILQNEDLGVGETSELTSPLLARPEWYISGRIGARYVLFQGDLDADVYLRARYWPDFAGRVLHRQTGLLAIPSIDNLTIASSAAVDFIAEAGVRGATVFVTLENFLSGSELIVGNQLVPGYPLAQRRFRFGLHWPILN